MSDYLIPLIETLPVELLHRIFDNLDAETILFSIRPVCRLFRSVVNNYNRYDLNLKLISKPSFYLLCRLINPQNVISLTLSNDERTSNQIYLFLSIVSLQEFTRLRFLTLLNIDEHQLNLFLERINLNILTSLSFNIRKYDETCLNTTTNLFSSLFTQRNFYKLECGIGIKRMSTISWPINCTIQHLIITEGMTIDNLFTIFQCSSQLHTLTIKQSFNEIIKNNIQSFPLSRSFQQLRSLSIEVLDATIDKLEPFLLLTPSLIYLKLVSLNIKIDGKRWERFIEIHLVNLKKFEFYFVERNVAAQNEINLELITASFRTPFWIENKKWFIICEYYMLSGNIRLYSIPTCTFFTYYEPKIKTTSLSTYPVMLNNDSSIMNNVKSLNFRSSEELDADIQQKRATTNNPLFRKVTRIIIDFYSGWPLFPLQSLFVFIDISKIVQIELNIDKFQKCSQNIWTDLGMFIEQAYNLSSLIIWNICRNVELDQIIDNIYSIVPYHVKHLQIPMNNLDQVKMILERCENLSTIKLDINRSEFSKEIIEWFNNNTIDSTCCEGTEVVFIWLGKIKFQSNKMEYNNKRIKLTNDHVYTFRN